MAVSAYVSSASRPRASSLIALLITAAVLYLAQEVLIPLALAILFSFLLAPAVRRLEQWKLGRIASTLIVALLGFGLIFAVAGVAAMQAVSLAGKLPEYRHNIVEKIHKIRHPNKQSNIGKAAEAIKDIEKEAAPERPPVPVKETPGTPVEAFAQFVAPVATPLAMTLAVIVFTILFLLNRENMRERVIALLGPGRIHVMTKAMAEASYRVSQYLMTQVLVNAMFGIPFGIALYFIGIPNAALFGLLGFVLRFIPYIGVWIAMAMPALLAFAISDGWSPVIWTLGVFFALESVLAYVIEPWLYGKSAGLSPIAIILAVVFWTWLWGPVGLLLATPLTVCVAVMGRYIPEFGYLNMLLGVEPVLSPEERFYQRLVALDHEEAGEVLEQYLTAHGISHTFDEVVIPALSLAERDRQKGALEPARERYIFESVRRIVEELEHEPAPATGAPLCIVPAHDDADHLAAMMVSRLLPAAKAVVLAPPPKAAEVAETVAQKSCGAILISAVPPHTAHYAGDLARRLRRQVPGVKIAVGLWGASDGGGRVKERLEKLGVDEVITTVSQAADMLRQLASAANQEQPAQERRSRPQ
ncbi:MAG TPA: AI-2E family transporter [Burkholderiales bacterium]|nr:AI-2E family transporter [Burkholderiales bacterium]